MTLFPDGDHVHSSPADSPAQLQQELDHLDTVLQNLLGQLPSAITTAVESISDGTAAANRDKIWIGAAVFMTGDDNDQTMIIMTMLIMIILMIQPSLAQLVWWTRVRT